MTYVRSGGCSPLLYNYNLGKQSLNGPEVAQTKERGLKDRNRLSQLSTHQVHLAQVEEYASFSPSFKICFYLDQILLTSNSI